MEKSRRNFLKKSAVAVGSTAVAASVVGCSSNSTSGSKNNGVIVGKSPKKEILYTKTAAWEAYYKQAL